MSSLRLEIRRTEEGGGIADSIVRSVKSLTILNRIGRARRLEALECRWLQSHPAPDRLRV